MTGFRCIPIATETAARFRATGRDDRGNRLRQRVRGEDSSCPCRHCLRYARDGETVLLGSYDLPGPSGVYWTPSPIFVHVDDCPRYDGHDEIPRSSAVRSSRGRAYDAEDQCL